MDQSAGPGAAVTAETTLTEEHPLPISSQQPLPLPANPILRIAVRHWRGELSLAVSWWVVYVGGSIAYRILSSASLDDIDVRVVALASLSLLLFHLILVIWQHVGTWRSAAKHISRGGRLWAQAVVRFLLVLGWMRFISYGALTFTPQAIQYLNILAGDQQIQEFEIATRGDIVQFSGGLRAGAANAFREVLRANPEASTLVLRSNGGRLHEALRMAKLIREREMNVVAVGQCGSAANLVLLAGKQRYAVAGCIIGFHRVHGHTWSRSQMLRDPAQPQEFRKAGIPEWFIEKVVATSPEDQWLPTEDELLKAGVVHEFLPAEDEDEESEFEDETKYSVVHQNVIRIGAPPDRHPGIAPDFASETEARRGECQHLTR